MHKSSIQDNIDKESVSAATLDWCTVICKIKQEIDKMCVVLGTCIHLDTASCFKNEKRVDCFMSNVYR